MESSQPNCQKTLSTITGNLDPQAAVETQAALDKQDALDRRASLDDLQAGVDIFRPAMEEFQSVLNNLLTTTDKSDDPYLQTLNELFIVTNSYGERIMAALRKEEQALQELQKLELSIRSYQSQLAVISAQKECYAGTSGPPYFKSTFDPVLFPGGVAYEEMIGSQQSIEQVFESKLSSITDQIQQARDSEDLHVTAILRFVDWFCHQHTWWISSYRMAQRLVHHFAAHVYMPGHVDEELGDMLLEFLREPIADPHSVYFHHELHEAKKLADHQGLLIEVIDELTESVIKFVKESLDCSNFTAGMMAPLDQSEKEDLMEMWLEDDDMCDIKRSYLISARKACIHYE